MRFLRALSALLLTASISLLCGREARAVPLVEEAEHFVVLDGSFKSFLFGLHMPHYPDDMLVLFGAQEDRGGMAIADVRLKLQGEHKGRWKWSAHFRTQPMISTFPNARAALGTGGSARPARSLPLQTTSPSDPRLEWYHEVDRLQVEARIKTVNIIVGRQPVSFGVGFVWQPADLVGTFSPLEVDREYKPGVDAVRVNWLLGAFTELAFVAAAGGPACTDGSLPSGEECNDYEPRFSLDHSVALTRFRTTVGKWDLGGIAGWVRGDVVGGVFATGSVDRFRIRSEAVVTYDIEKDMRYAGEEDPSGGDEIFVRAVLGADYKFDIDQTLFVLAELYYNGFGSTDPKDYFELYQRPRVSEFGEVLNLGMFYAAVGVNWEPHYRVPISVTAMGNLTDPSMHLSATVTYKLGDNSILEGGAFIPIGEPPKTGELGPLDIELQSEFGFYPYVYYLAWKMYY
jgi:hypothetical protein